MTMTAPQQPDGSYPESWGFRRDTDPNPIAGLTSGLGVKAEHTDDTTPYPADWRMG
jgi:hypothetical protein